MDSSIKPLTNRWYEAAITTLLVASITILMISLLSWQIPLGSQIQLAVGEVAPYDVDAPRQITYESEVLTEQAKERAAQQVPDQYDSAEGRVRRQQVERVREILDFITIIRTDALAGTELKTDYLLAINDLELDAETVLDILGASPKEWETVVIEVPLTLDRVMREEIRETNISVVQRRVPSFVSTDLPDLVTNTTVDIVRSLIRPNSLINKERTEEAKQLARSGVQVVMNTLERGEIIIRAGDRAGQVDVEALEKVGVLQAEWDWWILIRGTLFTLSILAVATATLYRLSPITFSSQRRLAMLVVVGAIWLLTAKLMILPHDWLPYLYPLAAMGMLIAVLLDLNVAIIMTVAFSLVIHYLGNNNMALVAYMGIGTLMGAVTLGRAERLTAFLWAGLAVALSNLVVFAAFRSPFTEFNAPKLMQTLLVFVLNGGLSASIALLGYYVMGNLFGITTSLQLTELSRPTHPLLRQLLLNASGTYHHTIIVSNLAERAAAAIGADAFLARVGAYYHDIGKTVRPYFFAENVSDGTSPHDKLEPLTSAQIIISHVTDGIDLAQKYRLPERIQDFIREHHGRSLVQYFYIEAQRQAKEGEVVDEADFRYDGPSPQTKETAILLLADTCEAAVRAIRPTTRDELGQLINRLVDERVDQGELDQCDLTFKELQTIKEVFLHVLQGVHHPRVQYPPKIEEQKPTIVPEPLISAPSATGASATAVAPQALIEPAHAPASTNGMPFTLPGGIEQSM